jgi:hypothetical protein
MAQDKALVQRGLIMLGFMAALALLVVFVLLRRPTTPPPPSSTEHPELVTLAVVPNGTAGFPGRVNWAALAKLSETLPSSPGWKIRYNATIALARRGSPDVPFNTVCEMLDEQRQMCNFRAKLANGQEVADESAARRTILDTLRALVEWHKVHKSRRWRDQGAPELRKVYAAIDRLTHSTNETLRDEAVKTKKELAIQ